MKNPLDFFKSARVFEHIDKLTDDEAETAEKSAIKHKNRVDEELKKLVADDEKLKLDYENYKPNIEVEYSGKNHLIKFGGKEFIAEFCTHLSIEKYGHPPSVDYHLNVRMGLFDQEPHKSARLRGAVDGSIEVHLVSGNSIVFHCCRHSTETLFEALSKSHKEAMI